MTDEPTVKLDEAGKVVWTRDVKQGEVVEVSPETMTAILAQTPKVSATPAVVWLTRPDLYGFAEQLAIAALRTRDEQGRHAPVRLPLDTLAETARTALAGTLGCEIRVLSDD